VPETWNLKCLHRSAICNSIWCSREKWLAKAQKAKNQIMGKIPLSLGANNASI
jgi:hypothetical protein